MRFLISLLLPLAASGSQRARAAALLDALSAIQIAPQLWVVNGEGATPATAHELADQFLSIIGEGDSAQLIVVPMLADGTGFGLSDDIARAIGAV